MSSRARVAQSYEVPTVVCARYQVPDWGLSPRRAKPSTPPGSVDWCRTCLGRVKRCHVHHLSFIISSTTLLFRFPWHMPKKVENAFLYHLCERLRKIAGWTSLSTDLHYTTFYKERIPVSINTIENLWTKPCSHVGTLVPLFSFTLLCFIFLPSCVHFVILSYTVTVHIHFRVRGVRSFIFPRFLIHQLFHTQ